MSYLAWPVLINGAPGTLEHRPYHLTLKYFGDTNVSAMQIKQRLAGIRLTLADQLLTSQWSLQLWHQRNKPEHLAVLELLNPPFFLREARSRFEDIRQDDFQVYRPHITISEDWDKAMKYVTPGKTQFQFGPLALMGLG